MQIDRDEPFHEELKAWNRLSTGEQIFELHAIFNSQPCALVRRYVSDNLEKLLNQGDYNFDQT